MSNTKTVIVNLLKMFAEMEEKSDLKYKYYCLNDSDRSNCIHFGSLSNGNLIVLKSKFPEIYLPTIMTLFQGLYDKSDYPLRQLVYDAEEVTGLRYFDEDDREDYYDGVSFEGCEDKLLELFMEEVAVNGKNEYDEDNYVKEVFIYNKVPKTRYDIVNYKIVSQEVYTLDDVIKEKFKKFI